MTTTTITTTNRYILHTYQVLSCAQLHDLFHPLPIHCPPLSVCIHVLPCGQMQSFNSETFQHSQYMLLIGQ